jgi:carbon-monoxide dehydrogenase medium subunit
MPISHEFTYCKPATLREALKTLTKFGNTARILAGGTDLVVRLKEGIEEPAMLIDIKAIDELKKIELIGRRLHIGALVTFTDLINSTIVKEEFPLLHEASKTVASVGTRNRATVVGNICSAVPSLDSGPALLNYDAIVCVKSARGKRNIPINQWFTGPKKTMREPDEIVTGLIIPRVKGKHRAYYGKLGRYSGEDLAQAGVGILGFRNDQYRIAFCAVGPVPRRAEKLEALLFGKKITDELIEQCKQLIEEEISPITDIRASKEYRMHMVKTMFERGIRQVTAKK